MATESSLAIAANVFTAPNEAFRAIKERSTVFLPLVILLGGVAAVQLLYTSRVDLAWLMEAQLEAANVNLTEAQREQAVANISNLPPLLYGAFGAVSSGVILALVMFVIALYYTGVSFLTNDGVRLRQWFALIAWCTLPMALGMLAQVVNLLAVDPRFLLQDEINPLSFANLFSIDLEGATIVQRILLSIDPTALWALVLTILGYQAWTKSSIAKAVAVVLGPLAAIVLIATLVALS